MDGRYGSIAQLGEHLPYKQRVIGSSPIVSTSGKPRYNQAIELGVGSLRGDISSNPNEAR